MVKSDVKDSDAAAQQPLKNGGEKKNGETSNKRSSKKTDGNGKEESKNRAKSWFSKKKQEKQDEEIDDYLKKIDERVRHLKEKVEKKEKSDGNAGIFKKIISGTKKENDIKEVSEEVHRLKGEFEKACMLQEKLVDELEDLKERVTRIEKSLQNINLVALDRKTREIEKDMIALEDFMLRLLDIIERLA